jgi:hypothetical protein
MLRRVALVRTEVSEEISASFIRVTEAQSSSETSVLTRVIRRNIPEVAILHSHRRENLKSYKLRNNFPFWMNAIFSVFLRRFYHLH